jgi:hypothetical protein
MTPIEQTILAAAAEKLRQLCGLTLVAKPLHGAASGLVLEIRSTYRQPPLTVRAIIKPFVSNESIAAIIHRPADEDEPPLLITHYINPRMADRLKEKNLWFLDCAGNVFLNAAGMLIFIKGNAPEKRAIPGAGRLFRPAGLKLLFALLCNPGLEQRSYREIAAVSDIALGSVVWAANELKTMGYLIETRQGGRRVVNKKDLFDRWVEHYILNLRPGLFMGRYQAANEGWWKNASLNHEYWGGEVAAHQLTGHIKPQSITLYADQVPAKLVLANTLKKKEDGDIELFKKFWLFAGEGEEKHLTPAILVYADLLAHADARNTEIAGEVYEKEIVKYLRED